MRGRLYVEDSLDVLRQLSEATAAARIQGMVHRDLKPSNLFLVEGDPAQLKVLDFGVARIDDPSHRLTLSKDVLGTVGYMAPEQAMGARDLDAQADLFELGCVLNECLTRRPAFAVGDNCVPQKPM
jgi:serine/threonine protein kinase